MRLRIIILILSIQTLLAVAIGGYLYYSTAKEALLKEAENQTAIHFEMNERNLAAYLSTNIKPAKTLAGMKELVEYLYRPKPGKLKSVNLLLDHFQQTLQLEACYLINSSGVAVASSNRDDPDSFVGTNFSFRPYFRESMQGHASNYLAVGITSQKRGAYYSHPVYSQHDQITPAGVVVLKLSIEQIEQELSSSDKNDVLVTDPNGIIFISTRHSWLFHTMTPLARQQIDSIVASKQFGKGPWKWSGLRGNKDDTLKDTHAQTNYLYFHTDLQNYPGWRFYYLVNTSRFNQQVTDPFVKIAGQVVLVFLIVIGIAVTILYQLAISELKKRRTVEQALNKAKEELSEYSKNLERTVKKRTSEISNLLKYTPAVVYLKKDNGCYTLVNSRFEELVGLKSSQIVGKTDEDILSADIARQMMENDQLVYEAKKSRQTEEQFQLEGSVRTFLTVRFPIYEESGKISGIGGISTDISELKKAEDKLRRFSRQIIYSQESERSAIARELHDELGQILTAFSLEASWLANRLKDSDEKAHERVTFLAGQIDQTISEVRNLSIRLRPVVLDDLGLIDALEWLANDFEKRTQTSCVFKPSNMTKVLNKVDNTIATAIYRITQEALTNITRHAEAGSVEINLANAYNHLVLTIADDGKGFQSGEEVKLEGLGLVGMQERASLIGGELVIQSIIGEGTTVKCLIPLFNKSIGYT